MLFTFKFRKCYKLCMDNFEELLPTARESQPKPTSQGNITPDTIPLKQLESDRAEVEDLIDELAELANYSDTYRTKELADRLRAILKLNSPTTPLNPVTSIAGFDDDFLDTDVDNDIYPDNFEEYDRSLARRAELERAIDRDGIEYARKVKTVIQDLQKIASRIGYIDQDFKNGNYVDRETDVCVKKINDVLDSLYALGIDPDSDILTLLNDVLDNFNFSDPQFINLKDKIDEIVSLVREEYGENLLVSSLDDSKHLLEELEKNLQEIVSGNFRNEINDDPHAYLVGDTAKQKIEDLLFKLDYSTKYPDTETASRSKIVIKFILDFVNGRIILSTQDVLKYITELKSYIV